MNTQNRLTLIVVVGSLWAGTTAWAQSVSVDERALKAAAARAAEVAQEARTVTGVRAAFDVAGVRAAMDEAAYAVSREGMWLAQAAASVNWSASSLDQKPPNMYVSGAYLGTNEQALYSQATSAMDESRWDRALELFTRVVALKGDRMDGALYWKAYVQNKLGQRAEALATIQELLKNQPNSRWVSDTKALEVEVRNASGQPVKPEAESDDDLKLLALNGLLNADPEQATAILQKLLAGPQSRKIKQRALFVLSQSKSPKSRDLLISVAKGSSNPDLQREALSYLGITRSKENKQILIDIYGSTKDKEVKRKILQAYMMAGENELLLAAARSESDTALRIEAIRQLGMMRVSEPLSLMFGTEINADVKREIVRAFGAAGDAERVTRIARAEGDAKVRVEAIRSLGTMKKEKTAAALVELYNTAAQSVEVRKAIVDALAMQGDAKILVEIARKETNPELRKQLVQQLSTMKAKEATDFMLELINK